MEPDALRLKRNEAEEECGAQIPASGLLPTVWQRIELFVVVVFIHLFDHMVSENLTGSGVLSPEASGVISTFESVGGILLFLLGVVAIAALLKSSRRMTAFVVAVYLSFALLHLLVNMSAILLTADQRRGQPLVQLWDVILVYFMGVLVFTAWYWFLDRTIPGGAFMFPSKHCKRTIIDYLFISFNTSATYGPTTEVPTSQVAKILMMLQVCSSLLVLTVLLTRAISG